MTSSADYFEGSEVPPDAEDWIRANPHEARRILEGVEREGDPDAPEVQPPPVLEWAHEGRAEFPKPILGCAKMGGAVLSEGEICVLSAAGGTGKSTLAVSIALSVAAADDNAHNPMELQGELFHGFGGKVVYATYEDPPSVLTWKLRELAKQWDAASKDKGRFTEALQRVAVASMRGWPLYGPVGDRASYNSVPGTLAGWDHLWKLVDEAKPILVIIDPVLASFVGDANSPTQVMAFLDAQSTEVGKRKAGLIQVTHSTKSSRSDRSDPFHPGMVSGTGAWTDHVRGVLTMGEHKHKAPGSGRPERGPQDEETEPMNVLRVYKANWGPQRITVRLEPVTAEGSRAPLGFVADGPWVYGAEPGVFRPQRHPRSSKTNGAAPANQEAFNDFA